MDLYVGIIETIYRHTHVKSYLTHFANSLNKLNNYVLLSRNRSLLREKYVGGGQVGGYGTSNFV